MLPNNIYYGTTDDDELTITVSDSLYYTHRGNDSIVINGVGIAVENTTVRGGAGDDSIIVEGSVHDNLFAGGRGHDTIDGSGSGAIDNEFRGGRGDDNLIGGYGNDTMHGGRGDDHIHAGFSGHNVIFGGRGDDWITGDTYSTFDAHGGHGNDAIAGMGNMRGGTGDDALSIVNLKGASEALRLTGGTGDDTFSFINYRPTDKIDVRITDFGRGNDVLDLTGNIDSDLSFDDFVRDHAVQHGDNTIIHADNGFTIVLVGVDVDALTSSNVTY